MMKERAGSSPTGKGDQRPATSRKSAEEHSPNAFGSVELHVEEETVARKRTEDPQAIVDIRQRLVKSARVLRPRSVKVRVFFIDVIEPDNVLSRIEDGVIVDKKTGLVCRV